METADAPKSVVEKRFQSSNPGWQSFFHKYRRIFTKNATLFSTSQQKVLDSVENVENAIVVETFKRNVEYLFFG